MNMSAISTFSSIGLWPTNSVCVCVCGGNELKVCATLAYPHISSFSTMPVYTHTNILIPFKDLKPTGLKVDIASMSACLEGSMMPHFYCCLVVESTDKGNR